jgi:hypothetical protein
MTIKDREPGASEPPVYCFDDQDHSSTPLYSDRLRPESLSGFLLDQGTHDLPPQSLLAHRRSLWTDSTTDPPKTKVFAYDIQRKGRTWAELSITADELISTKTPTFLEGSPIEGQVMLRVAQAEAINSVVVSVSIVAIWRAPHVLI